MDGKTARGASSPAKPALHIPDPLSTTRAAASSSHIVVVVVVELTINRRELMCQDYAVILFIPFSPLLCHVITYSHTHDHFLSLSLYPSPSLNHTYTHTRTPHSKLMPKKSIQFLFTSVPIQCIKISYITILQLIFFSFVRPKNHSLDIPHLLCACDT